MEPKTDPNADFWCFLSRGPVQIHNREVGLIASVRYLRLADTNLGSVDASYLPLIPNPECRGVMGLFQLNIISDYVLEYNLELGRLARFPRLPSRFSALHVFSDAEEAEKAGARYGWSAGSDLVRLRPVHPEVLCSYSRHDMEFISITRGRTTGLSDWDHLIEAYWGGEACQGMIWCGQPIHSQPIWEVLYDGALAFAD